MSDTSDLLAVRTMYEGMRLDQTYSEGDYFHLDIELKWLRGVKLHRDLRFKFFRHKRDTGLEFRAIAGWPTMFQVWPGDRADQYGPLFLISTGDTQRLALARLDSDGKTLVDDIAADLFGMISALLSDAESKIADGATVLREVIRLCDYIAGRRPEDSPRPSLTDGALRAIAAMLEENQTLLTELQDTSAANNTGVLAAYLANIRKDGLPKQADMKRKLERLAENNVAIVTLMKLYSPHARTAAFSMQGELFRSYASAWGERWNSVIELVLTDGDYGEPAPAFPKELPAALDAEIAAANTPSPA